jgi:hypothetical protein
MSQFSLTTIWTIPAPIEKVWLCLLDTENWTVWWQYVVNVEETHSGELSGLNNTRRYLWRTCLPYTLLLNLRVTQLQAHEFVSVEVSGDLHGQGCCRLLALTSSMTEIEFNWNVSTCKPWMNYFTWLTRPVFAWNHAKVMQNGEQSLIRYLTAKKT